MNMLQNAWQIAKPSFLRERHRLSYHQISMFTKHEIDKIILLNEKKEQLTLLNFYLSLLEKAKEANLNFISFKGPVLSYQLYGDATVRIYKDFDILIEWKNLDETIAFLLQNGFKLIYREDWLINDTQRKLIYHHLKDVTLIHPLIGCILEVHWAIFHRHIMDYKQQENLVQKNCTTVNFINHQITTISNELLLVYLLVHGSRHRWARMKWLLDLRSFNTENIDKTKFIHLVKSLKAEKSVALAFKIYLNVFQQTFPLVFSDSNIFFLYDKSIYLLNSESDISTVSMKNSIIEIIFQMGLIRGFRSKLKLLNDLFISEKHFYILGYNYYIYFYVARVNDFIKRRILNTR